MWTVRHIRGHLHATIDRPWGENQNIVFYACLDMISYESCCQTNSYGMIK